MKTFVAWMLAGGLALVLVGCNDQKTPPVANGPSQPAPPPTYPTDAGAANANPTTPEPVVNEPPPPAPAPEPVDTASPRPKASKAHASGNGGKKATARQAPKESYSKSSKSAGGRTYTVKKGDTLQEISQKYYGTTKNWRKIYSANKGKIGSDPNKLTEGMKISIP